MEEFAKRLKLIRILRGLTTRQVAQLIDRTSGTISNWETGKISPDVDSVAKLCEVYDISPNELLGWEPCPEIEDFLAEKKDKIEAMEALIEEKNRLEAQIKSFMKELSTPDKDIEFRFRDPSTNTIKAFTLEAMKKSLNDESSHNKS